MSRTKRERRSEPQSMPVLGTGASDPIPLLHVPACGVRAVPTFGASVVIDPGRTESVRMLRLLRARLSALLLVSAFIVCLVSAPIAVSERDLWMPLGALGFAILGRLVRPPHRTIPHTLLPDLDWLSAVERQDRGLAHRLLWAAVTEPIATRPDEELLRNPGTA